ncbi:MAG: hypothetical protein WDN03_04795 [Rhizomicrobium sp.]
MLRILIAGLLGGLAMYIWSTIAHVATPLGAVGVDTLPNQSITAANLASSVGGRPGLYLFPMNMSGTPSAATAPGGFLVFNPHTPTSIRPSNLVIEFLTELVEAVLAAWLLAQTALAAYGARVAFVTVVGIAAAIITNVPYWNWYGFPLDYTLAYGFVEIAGFLAAGLVIAAILRPRTTA